MILLLLLVPAAPCQAVTVLPAGSTRAGLLVCSGEDACSRRAWRVAEQPGWTEPFVVEDVFAEQVSGSWSAGDRNEALAAELARARSELAGGRPLLAEAILEGAAASLRGRVPGRLLFELAWLRGAAVLRQGGDPGGAFRQAAAVAWNRDYPPPLDDDRARAAAATAVEELLARGSSTLRIEAPPGVSLSLDGIELGEGPVEVQVLEGRHRLCARRGQGGRTWEREIRTFPGRSSSVRAMPERTLDPGELHRALEGAMEGEEPSSALRSVLSGWCEQAGVVRLRLVEVRGDTLRERIYEPLLRRFEGAPADRPLE